MCHARNLKIVKYATKTIDFPSCLYSSIHNLKKSYHTFTMETTPIQHVHFVTFNDFLRTNDKNQVFQ